MSRKCSRAQHFHTVVEDLNMNVISYAVVAVQHRIGDYLVKGFGWVFDLF